jgi:hypothetical protein
MKVAIVICGQPRFFEGPTYESYKKYLLDKYECDIYAHFWFTDDPTAKFITAPWSGLGTMSFPPDTIDRFSKLYSPKKLAYDPPLEYTVPDDNIDSRLPRQYIVDFITHHIIPSKCTSLQRAYSLIDNIDSYDFIVYTRSDNVIIRMPELTTLYRNYIHLFATGHNQYLYNDAFFICPPNLSHYLFNEIDILDILENKGTLFNSEELFTAMIHYYKLSSFINVMPIEVFNLGLQRANGEVSICKAE